VVTVATFQYRCLQDGGFDVRRPIGEPEGRVRCPVCGTDAIRVFSAPSLSLAPRALVAAIDRTERTRDEPDVVSTVPTRGLRRLTPTAPADPRLQRLPRPWCGCRTDSGLQSSTVACLDDDATCLWARTSTQMVRPA